MTDTQAWILVVSVAVIAACYLLNLLRALLGTGGPPVA
jgi:hypothetical protein